MNDPHLTGVTVHGIALIGALELWATRDDQPRPANPDAYGAASVAVREIDAMLAELRQLRARVITENRQFGDAAMARSADLLAGRTD